MSMEEVVRSHSGYLDSPSWMEFCNRLFDRNRQPELVVAIARKMPRILEYLGSITEAPCAVVTDRALSWVSNDKLYKGETIFCDDVLNVGSTLTHYVQYAQKHGLTNIRVNVYAQREGKQHLHRASPLSKLDLSVFRTFDERSYWQFETALPQELLSNGKPYEVDFPIISLPLSSADALRSPEQWYEALNQRFWSVHNLTTLSQRKAGVTSLSVIEPLDLAIGQLLPMYKSNVIPIVKVRLFISKSEHRMRVVPMCIPGIPTNDLQFSGNLFGNELDEIWGFLSKKPLDGGLFPDEPRYNLLLYLLSFEYGRFFLPHVRHCLSEEFNTDARLSEIDLQFLFGRKIGRELQEQLELRLSIPIREVGKLQSSMTREHPQRPLKDNLYSKVVERLVESNYQGAMPSQVIPEVMRIIDEIVGAEEPVGNQYPDYLRLRNGLPLCDLWLILNKICTDVDNISLEQMSFLLDYYVDLGAIVPVVEEFDGVYLRTYRRGEADPVEFAQFIHGLLRRHENIFSDSPLRKRFFSKILAVLGIYHPGKVPIAPMFEFKGTVPFVVWPDKLMQEAEEAIGFLVRKQVIRFEPLPVKEEDDQLLLF